MSDSLKYDTRVLPHQIRRGVTSDAEIQSYLEALEDCADMATETETRFDNPYEKRHKAIRAQGDDAGIEPPPPEA